MCFFRSAAIAAGVALAGATSPTVWASCGAAVCALNTQWEVQGAWTEPGWRADLRFEYINQNQPRSGRDKVSARDQTGEHEEIRTLNRNWIASLDYTIDPHWGVTLLMPWVDRDHHHIHDPTGAAEPETWDFSSLGDARLVGRYQTTRSGSETQGFIFGLKLPTGRTDEKNSEGEEAERSLQPGTGTTDVIVGVFTNADLTVGATKLRGFAQATIQTPLNEHDDYKPGTQYLVDAGVSYPFSRAWAGMLQANLVIRDRDDGDVAEPDDSGGTYVWLSPGLSYAPTRNSQLYGFVQLPLYQHVNGIQLTANIAFAVGASWRF